MYAYLANIILPDNQRGDTISAGYDVNNINQSGDIFLQSAGGLGQDNRNELNPGEIGYMTILHELGHALGLEHPGSYSTGDVPPFLDANVNDTRHTVMSYNRINGWLPSKPMLYDIAAIQYLYGVNPNTNAGDNTYQFKTDAIDAIQAIWDAGGTDTIDASDQSVGVTIDLQPGHFSFVGNNEETSQQQIAIAYQVAGYENNWIENAIGGGGNDKLIGNNADNQLSGGEGQDTMLGGSGNDTYLVDNTGDVVIENANEGTDDTVRSSATYTLGGNVETLILTGTDALNGTGNALNNTLTGNHAANTLDGGSGADTLIGGAGDDVYVVDNTGDVVIENANEGTDTVRSSITYTLSENVEKLILTETGALDGTGNARNNTLTGNNAANTLIGGAGQDTLIGGSGNDILHGDDGAGGDILEGGAGHDTYYADEGDTIRDSDSKGTIYLNGKQLTFAKRKKGETIWTDAAGNAFTLNGTTLLINDPLTIENFSNGRFGIYLDEQEAPSPSSGSGSGSSNPLPGPAYNPTASSSVRRWDPLALDLDGNGRIDAVASTTSTTYFDFNGDGIAEKSGWVAAQDGMLALDANNNGAIDDLSELFGSATQDGFVELAGLDTNKNRIIDSQDTDYSRLRVWQDSNQDGITQSGELHTLTDLNISAINLAATPANLPAADNLITATGSFTRNGQTQLAADIHLTVNFAQTDSNPNRPLDQAPTLSADVFDLPWLRGYGLVKSLHVAYQESAGLKQAAADLIAQGRDGILANFDGFLAQWSGLAAAHAAHGVTRTTLTTEDKVWMLETFTGQNVRKSTIEAANFGAINPGGQVWDTNYIETQYRRFANREAINFTLQATAKDWLQGAYYSLALDSFVALDASSLQAGLQQRLNAVTNEADANFAAVMLVKLKLDGVDLAPATMKQGIAASAYAQLFNNALDFSGKNIWLQTSVSAFSAPDGNDWFVAGSSANDSLMGGAGNDVLNGGAGNDTLQGGAGNDTLDGGAGSDSLQGGAGNDIYLFGRGSGQDVVADYDMTAGNLDKIQIASGVLPTDVKVTRDSYHLYLSINNPDGTTDKLTLQNWFVSGDAYKVEQVVFTDAPATIWNVATLNTLANPPTENADYLTGTAGDDTIYGLGGNDTLVGGAGNDTLDGGAGSDSLQGSTGNDTYVFGRGSGQDVIADYDTTAGNFDKVQVVAGILPADVKVTRDWYHLYFSINNLDGTTDKLTLQNWFSGDAYKVEQVVFADDPTTVWDVATLNTLANVPTENADYLSGLSGNDVINGLGGNDTLLGDAGNDTLDGGMGNDSLQGGIGNDTYVFGRGFGQDTVYDYDLTAGNLDKVRIVSGVLPADVKVARDQSNLYLSINNPNGTADKLTLRNWFSEDAYKVEQVLFTDDPATVWDTSVLSALANAPSENADYVEGTVEDDTINGLGGNDTLVGGAGNDTLMGGMGNDTVQGGTGNDTLDGGTGNDYLQGNAGNDIYLFGRGSGQDTIIDYDTTAGNLDKVQIASGILPEDVKVTRDQSNLYLSINNPDGTTDKLTLQNWFSQNAYKVEQVLFADDPVRVWDVAALSALANVASENTDYIDGTTGDDAINGLGGNDTLVGGAGNDTLMGGMGNDTLQGGTGNDTLDGGTGNDYLQDGAGNDTYLFGRGSGQDIVGDYDITAGNIDTIRFGADIAASDIEFGRNGNDLLLSINGTSDQLRIQNWDYYGDAYRIERVEFADGTVWGAADLPSQLSGLPFTGTSGNDNLSGDSGNNTLDGGAGNDTLQGGAGSDTYLFNLGDGQDTIYEYDTTAGNIDTIRFGTGISANDIGCGRSGGNLILSINGTADQLRIQNWDNGDAYRIERVEFADGTVWGAADLPSQLFELPLTGTSGNDNLSGDSGNNTLDGGAGNDTLQGGAGNDTYLFNRGGGQDTISDYDYTAGNIDTVRFGAGIATGNITFNRSGRDLVLSINGTTDQLKIQNWASGDYYRIERVQFADGTLWNAAYLQAHAITKLTGTSGNDTLSGDSESDMLDGRAGNDILQGGAGNDIYLFNLGDGQDTILDYDYSSGNVDTIRFGAGIAMDDITFSHSGYGGALVLGINGATDQLTIENWNYGNYYHIEKMEFADGTVWDIPIVGTSGDDYLTGDSGNDTLNGGAGNDTLVGGTGNDTYLFNLGGGQDIISEFDTSAGNVDTIRFGAGITADDITFSRNGNDLVLSINGTTDQLTIHNWGYRDGYQIERVAFVDGSSWDALYLQTQIPAPTFEGTSGNDTLTFWKGESGTFQGMEGDDMLYGSDGNDILDGGAGNDYLAGGLGNDVYVFGLGGGQDSIYDSDSSAGNMDTVLFGIGITADDITFSHGGYGGDLVLGINGTSDQVTLQNWGYGDDYRIERVEFADGTAWDAAQLQALATAAPIIGTGASDSLSAWAAENATLRGLGGNDALFGNDGNDILDGGTGNDYLSGNTGNDTYLFNLGDGQDTIAEYDNNAGSIDTVRFGAGIAAGDITFSRSGNDLILSINGTSDQLRIQSWGSGDIWRIERVEFADGTVWGTAELPSQLSELPLIGTSGDDYLTGDSGNNTLNGGAGNDTLVGGTGNDTYLFNLGGGQDRIFEYDNRAGNVDTVRFGAGITADDITFSRNGNDLVLSINGTTDQLTIQNWGSGNDYRIGRVEFADGTVWGTADLPSQLAGLPFIGTSGDDYLYGDSGNNTLNGGAGNDTLAGGTGNDAYLFNLGSGQDIINEYDSTAGNVDTVRFGTGIVADDIAFSRNGSDLVLSINGTDEQLKIQNWNYGDAYRIERIEFADGTVWGSANLPSQLAGLPVVGTSGNDYLAGDSGNNTLNGGAGNDTLIGGTGNDIYLFNLGDGQDTISEYDSSAGNVDTIRFGAGITTDDIAFSRNGYDLVLSINGTTDQLTIQDWGSGNNYRIERVEFADGTTAQLQAIMPAVLISGTEYGDYLQALSGENIMFQGLGGDDSLYGNDGNDILDGGMGNDYLEGGEGNDIYLFNRDSGQDIINEYDSIAGNVDTIRFGAGIAINDISFSRSGNNLVLSINGTSDQLTIQNWGSGNDYRIERVEFADGTAAQLQSIMPAVLLSGTEKADYLKALRGENTEVQGLGGNDILYGNDGYDILDGGTGNDYLSGNTGNDTYLFKQGSGQDTINEYDSTAGNVDTVRFGVGIAAGDIAVTRNGSDLVLGINGTTDQLTIQGWGYGNDYRIEQVEFADGTAWDAAQLQALVSAIPTIGSEESDELEAWADENAILQGLGGDDYLYGNNGNDILDGGLGNDYVEGGAGNDTYIFGRGYGQDEIEDWSDIASNVDTIKMADDVLPSDVSVTRGHWDMVLTINDTGDSITLVDWFYDEAAMVEQVVFADGTIWDTAYLQDHAVLTIVGSDGNDELSFLQGENGTLQGMEGDDELYGNNGNDILDGGEGNDYLSGSTGNDTYIVDSEGDVVIENADEGTDTVQSSIGYTLGDNVENLTLTGVDAIDGTGNDLDNVLTGNNAINVLSGGLGNDTYIIDSRGDVIIENADEGTDTVQSSISYTLGANVENLILTGTDAINGTGNGLDNVLIGNSATNTLTGGIGNDTLNGGSGADTLIGGLGNDSYVVDNAGDVVKETSTLNTEIDTVLSSITYTLGSRLENLTLTGTAAINGTGNSLNNLLIGNSGNNVLIGGTGADQLLGGLGNDTYVTDNVNDVITENSDEGIDTVQSSVTYILSDNVENLTLIGTSTINGTGNTLDNILTGNTGNNRLNGGEGADTMTGGFGDDTYVVDNIGDVVAENTDEGIDMVQSAITYTLDENVEKLTLTGTGAINATGNEFNNTLTGNAADNILDGSIGADIMKGGAGNDNYVVDNSADVVIEKANEGTDTVQSSITYTLSTNVENLTLTGASAINGTGNSLNNTLTGNSEDNVLSGGAGADQLLGGLGNDTYVVDNINDVIIENSDEGADTVQSSVTYTLSDNVENLTLIGTSAIAGTGNILDNILTGNSGNNRLNGGEGADTMTGGFGNDTYVVDNTGDVVAENTNEGIDTVQSAITYTLGENVEKLTLTGTDAIDGTGNELNNTLIGNEADNVLDGSTGADTMIGGLGNDTYVVDNASDVVKETSTLAAEIDTVLSSVSYTLSANVENLTLTGTSAINGTGNSLNNVLIGNSGNNVLTGGTGSDLLSGNLGSDILKGNAGNDILQGGADNDTLSDSAGTNLLDGGSGADTLSGNAANEMFAGGTGNDTISTGNGADLIAFNRGDGMDVVNGGTDNTLSLGGGIQYADLALSKTSNDLIVEMGNGDQITLTGWYDTRANHKSVVTLQMIADAIAGFDRASTDPLLNKSIRNYDFTAIVNAFDQANGGSANFMHWHATDSLLTAHLAASDSEALGGDLAYQYGSNGNFSGFSQTAAQDVLNNPSFGANPQLLHDLAGLTDGLVKLS